MVNKKQLSQLVSDRTGFSSVAIKTVLDAICDTIIEQVGQGNEVRLAGFGSFERGLHKSRRVPNPRDLSVTMETGDVYIPKFKSGFRFRNTLKDSK